MVWKILNWVMHFAIGVGIGVFFGKAQKRVIRAEQERDKAITERDAAAADAAIGQSCDTCLYGKNHPLTNPCMACGDYHNFWKWRGVCKENMDV